MNDVEEQLKQALIEEATLQFNSFSNETAFEVAKKIYHHARDNAWPITFDIIRAGQQLVHCAMPGTSVDNDEWIRRKNNVVNRFGHSSRYMGLYYQSLGKTIETESFLDAGEFIPYGGGFPISIKNTGVIGTVTVSGLPGNGDHEAVVLVLREILSL